jgi:hypothetical protein
VPDTDEMALGEFISLLMPPTRGTAADYYGFPVDWREAVGTPIVKELKVVSVLGTGGQVFTPEADMISFPRERGEVTIPDNLPVPIVYVPDVEDVRKLLRDLSVKPFERRDLIRDFLIKVLSDPEADPDARERAMAGLRAYHQVRLQDTKTWSRRSGVCSCTHTLPIDRSTSCTRQARSTSARHGPNRTS